MIVTYIQAAFVAVSVLGRGGMSADCDRDQVLTVADFSCYLERFAAGDVYADAVPGTAAPMLNVADFTAFLQAFAAGRVEPEAPVTVLEGAVVLGSGRSHDGTEYRVGIFGVGPEHRVTLDLRWPAAVTIGPMVPGLERGEFLFPEQ